MAGGGACVALTFDDGPDVNLTPRLLDTLQEKGVPATFFVLGYRAANWPDLVAREFHDGHEVGNHSWDHPHLTALTSDAAFRELTRTDDIITKITGQAPIVTRAPYGVLDERVLELSKRTYVAWSVDTLDWRYPNADRIVKTAVSKARDGSIILMHDIHPETIVAVPRIIDGLAARGFRMVTVSDLLSGDCGGHETGFGKQVPGEVAADPFGVEKFQTQIATAGVKPAPPTARPTPAHAAAPMRPATVKTASSKATVASIAQPVQPAPGLFGIFRKPTKAP